MYNCKLCNYNGTNYSNYLKHCNANIHINKEKLINYCILCDKKYSNNESFKTHKYKFHKKKINSCKNSNKINKINNKLDDIKNDIKNDMKNNMNTVKQEINDVKEEINNSKKEVVTVVNKAINKASSLIKYLMENHRSVPPLKKITKNQCIPILRLDYDCPEKDNDYSLQKIFIKDFSKNLFISNIAKSILKMINYTNKNTQPIYNTDSTRYNYVVKITTDLWNEDKSGIKFTDYIIRPLLRYIRDLIEEYIDNELEQVNMYKNTFIENEIHVTLKVNAYDLDVALTNDYLIKPILKELSPYLRFLQSELEELEKLEELDKIQEDLQEIIDRNNSSVDGNDDLEEENIIKPKKIVKEKKSCTKSKKIVKNNKIIIDNNNNDNDNDKIIIDNNDSNKIIIDDNDKIIIDNNNKDNNDDNYCKSYRKRMI